jgi:uncharacterized protein YodC (DUF2158 family)
MPDKQVEQKAFQIGDVVVLNSGGPKMTIVDISDDKVTINRFTQDGILGEVTFPREAVKLHDPNEDMNRVSAFMGAFRDIMNGTDTTKTADTTVN